MKKFEPKKQKKEWCTTGQQPVFPFFNRKNTSGCSVPDQNPLKQLEQGAKNAVIKAVKEKVFGK